MAGVNPYNGLGAVQQWANSIPSYLGPHSYTNDEADELDRLGANYPVQYSDTDRPTNAAAYEPPAFARLRQLYAEAASTAPKNQAEDNALSKLVGDQYNDFLKGHQQMISRDDLTQMRRDDLLANRSPLAALAAHKRGTDILVGNNRVIEEDPSDGKTYTTLGLTHWNPRMTWAASDDDSPIFSTREHELMHSAMMDIADNTSDKGLKAYLQDPEGQHAVMNSLNQKYGGTVDRRYHVAPPPVFDMVEAEAMKRIKAFQRPMGPR